jgi:hypothetical protein
MVFVRDATLDDEDKVVALLTNVFSGRPASYANIFRFARSPVGRKAGESGRPLGAVLERDDGSVAGFIGLLSSWQPRLSDGWVQHLTSWGVAEDARSQGLRLLNHISAHRDGVLVNLTATEVVQLMMPRFGYSPIDEAELTFRCFSPRGAWRRFSTRLKTGSDAAAFLTDQEQARIIQEHLSMGCHAFAFEREGRKISAVLLRRDAGLRSKAQLIHLSPSDDDARRSIWPALLGFALVDMKCPHLLVDARHAPPGHVPLVKKTRQMFAKGLSVPGHELTRAYGEPLNAWATFPSPDRDA